MRDAAVKSLIYSLPEPFLEMRCALLNFKNSTQTPKHFEIFNPQHIASLYPKRLNGTRKKTV
jgi:hypothetical protein